MEINITIGFGDIVDKIHQESAYVGAKSMGADSAAFERISTIDTDEPMLMQYVKDSFAALQLRLSRYHCECTSTQNAEDGTTSIEVSLNVPTNFGGSDDTIADILTSYFAKMAFCSWVTLSKAGNYEYYYGRANEVLTTLRDYLARRNKPTRKEPETIKYKKTTYE